MKEVKKRLIFYFYIPQTGYKSFSNEIHLRCLKHYSDIFDEALFLIATQEKSNDSEVMRLEKELIEIFNRQKITFKVVENSYLREAKYFYEEVALKLGELDGITFFGHSKGITNISSGQFEKETIYRWITAMYYGCLEFMNEVEQSLTDSRNFAYGTLLDIVNIKEVGQEWLHDILYTDLGKYSYLYTGTFFWLNTRCLKNFMDNKGISLPVISDRWYAENFLANIVEPRFCSSHNGAYGVNYLAGRTYIETLIKYSFLPEELERLDKFYNEITEGL